VIHRLRRAFARLPGALPRGVRVFARAMRNYIGHQSANLAGGIAFSSVLAMFPLVLFLSAAAGFIGEPGAAAGLVRRILEVAPPLVAQALQPVIDEVLARRNRVALTLGLLVTVWAASSGVQAIRTALNRSYGVERSLSFWAARLKVIAFTVVGTLGSVLAFSSVVILPYVNALAERTLGPGSESVWLRYGARWALAAVVLVVLYALFYAWLPDLRQRVRTVLPGALVGAALWLVAATVLSTTLRSAGKLALVYGGFTGLVATLVFLYVSAVTLIFGAEINAVLGEEQRSEGIPGDT
jgi:membrane protein